MLWNLSDVAEADLPARIQSFLLAHRTELPLEEACQPGGYPEVIQIDIDHLSRCDQQIKCFATVQFRELVSAGCATDINARKSCRLQIVIDAPGAVTITLHEELWDGQEYAE